LPAQNARDSGVVLKGMVMVEVQCSNANAEKNISRKILGIEFE